jgi:hypothetical protein
MPDFGLRILTTSNALVLDLTEANGYYLTNLVVPRTTRRREVVESPDMEGDVELQSVRAASELMVSVSCRGANDSAAWSLYSTLQSAVDGTARRFYAETTIRGRTEKWDSRRITAWALDPDPDVLRLYYRNVTFTLPVQPLPV